MTSTGTAIPYHKRVGVFFSPPANKLYINYGLCHINRDPKTNGLSVLPKQQSINLSSIKAVPEIVFLFHTYFRQYPVKSVWIQHHIKPFQFNQLFFFQPIPNPWHFQTCIITIFSSKVSIVHFNSSVEQVK